MQRIDGLAAEPAGRGVEPVGDVGDQLPDAVRAGDGMRRGGPGLHTGQQLADGRAEPGVAAIGSLELIDQPGDLA